MATGAEDPWKKQRLSPKLLRSRSSGSSWANSMVTGKWTFLLHLFWALLEWNFPKSQWVDVGGGRREIIEVADPTGPLQTWHTFYMMSQQCSWPGNSQHGRCILHTVHHAFPPPCHNTRSFSIPTGPQNTSKARRAWLTWPDANELPSTIALCTHPLMAYLRAKHLIVKPGHGI